MLDARETLVRFLGQSLASKRARLCEFASTPKNQDKFLDELNHRFGEYVAPRCTVPELPDAAWSRRALTFGGGLEFGQSFDSLREAWDAVDTFLGALSITADGRFGVWCDHHRMDDRVYIAIPSRVA